MEGAKRGKVMTDGCASVVRQQSEASGCTFVHKHADLSASITACTPTCVAPASSCSSLIWAVSFSS